MAFLPMSPFYFDNEAMVFRQRHEHESVLCAQMDRLTLCPLFHQTLLGGLPLELRQQIYMAVLGIPGPKTEGKNLPFVRKAPGSQRFALLGVCRQIYFEMKHLFYANLTFCMNGAQHLYDFLILIDTGRRHLRSLCVAPVIVEAPKYDKAYLDRRLSGLHNSKNSRIKLENKMERAIDPSLANSVWLLRNCSRLSNLYFDMEHGDEMYYIDWLGDSTVLDNVQIVLLSLIHWQAKAGWSEDDDTDLDQEIFKLRREAEKRRRSQLFNQKRTRRVMVEILSDPNEVFVLNTFELSHEIISFDVEEDAERQRQAFPGLQVT